MTVKNAQIEMNQLHDNKHLFLPAIKKLKRKIPQKTYEPARLQNGEDERRKNEDLEMLFSKPNIRLFLKEKRLEWTGHVLRAAKSFKRNVLSKKLQEEDLV
jgi:hypothetical protein